MNIAYVTTRDPQDMRVWSGLNTYILKALQSSGLQVQTIGSLRDTDTAALLKGFFYGRLYSRIYIRDWEPSLLKNYAVQVEKILASISFDVVFSSRTEPISLLRTEKPIVFWHDSTFAGIVGFYVEVNKIASETVRNGYKLDQLALSKCQLAIYSSEWAANTAIQYYDVDPAKVKVVPFGANLECSRNIQDIRANLSTKDFDTCRLLFIGKEWLRKGGDLAVEVADRLNQRGISTELHIAGCNPPGELPGFVKLHGFVSKSSEEGRRYLDNLFSRSHFLILPTRADCTPVVFPEACSFGLPILTTNVGGIPTVVHDGENGFAFPLDETPDTYCDVIERLWSSKQAYEQLALSSFREYSERLNWDTAGQRVADLIHEFCG